MPTFTDMTRLTGDRAVPTGGRSPGGCPPREGSGMIAYRTIPVDETDVFYREGGESAAPALLLLHGFPSSSAQYQSLMERLEGRYYVIAPDYPGFGQSAPLG